MLKVIAINIFLAAVGIAIVEAFWLVKFSDSIRFTLNVAAGIDRVFDTSNIDPNTPQPIRYSRSADGLRGYYPSVADIEMILIGGSTTDQRFIDNERTWDYVLRQELRKRIGREPIIVNAGVDGQSTVGHLRNFGMWFSRLEGFAPKYMLYYVGVNDFYLPDRPAVFDLDELDKTSERPLWERTMMYYLFRTIKGMIRAQQAEIVHATRAYFPSKVTTVGNLIDTVNIEEIMHDHLNSYQVRLTKLVDMTRKTGATPIFVTQRFSRYWEINGIIHGDAVLNTYGDFQYNGVDQAHLVRHLNNAVLSVCQKTGAICIDLEQELEFDLRADFYDPQHNTTAGAKRIGIYLTKMLQPLFDNGETIQ